MIQLFSDLGDLMWRMGGLGAAQGRGTIAPTVLADAMDTTDLAAYPTASIAPVANQPLLAAVVSLRAAGSIATPTCAGCGLTWTQVATSAIGTTRRLTVFKAAGIASPSAEAVTFTFDSGGAQTQDSAVWCVVQFAGAVATADPAVQFKTIAPAAGTTFTNTFDAALEHASNVHVSFVLTRDVSGVITHDADFAELADRTAGANSIRLETAWAVNQTAVTPTWGVSDSFASISVEVKAA